MIVHLRAVPEAVDPSISDRVVRDVTAALQAIRTIGDQFIVNDTPWFERRSHGQITARVMNTATFLSSKFQDTLRDVSGWDKNKELRVQEIDGFIALPAPGVLLRVAEDSFLDFFQAYVQSRRPANLRNEFLNCWHKFVQVGIGDLSAVEVPYRRFFTATTAEGAERLVRIGLEFETGNIASAFRALDKLETLFVLGEIDYGVFVTSLDKTHAAARIWPASNRNGSFQELENRNYRNNRTVPLWEFGFQPDGFRRDAPYLGPGCTLYMPTPTGKTKTLHGVTYEIFKGRQGEPILRVKD